MKLAALRPRLSMPVLTKELVELANRRRTYVVRFVYALLLFAAALLMLRELMRSYGGSPFGILGQGRQLFDVLVGLQFAGVYLFLPALVSGSISSEKEANSLQLLLVTDMGPWEILVSKLVSRVVPMLTFLLLGMPILAVAYAFGGVTTEALVAAIAMLLVATLQVACLCLFCSAWFSTTSSAFIASYLLACALYAALPLLYGIVWVTTGTELFADEEQVLLLIPWATYFETTARWGATPSYASIALQALPSLASAAAFLGLARAVFVRRALLPPKSALRALFAVFDRIFDHANKAAGGVVLIKDRGSLPGDNPVTWLETHQRALSKARYLIRILVLLETPVIIVLCVMLTEWNMGGNAEGLSGTLFFLWPLAGLMVTVQAAGAFAAERRRQTLDVLLATPMTGRELVLEKMAALRRLMLVVAAPLLTAMLLAAWWEHGYEQFQHPYTVARSPGGPLGLANNGSFALEHMSYTATTLLYLLYAFLSVLIYLPLIAYLAMAIGMRLKHPTRGTLAAVAAVVGWVAGLPMLVILFCTGVLNLRDEQFTWLLLMSPASIVPFVEFGELDEIGLSPVPAILGNFLFHGLLLALFRWSCLRYADRWLGRV